MRKLLLLIILISCNPVKQVLRDKDKLDQVAKVLVKDGWCTNDTIYMTKSDTLVDIDTLITTDTLTDTYIINDTVYITRWNTREITKTLTIHDTLRSVITDNAHIKLLQADSTQLTKKMNEYKQKADIRLSWLISLLILLGVFIYLKLKK